MVNHLFNNQLEAHEHSSMEEKISAVEQAKNKQQLATATRALFEFVATTALKKRFKQTEVEGFKRIKNKAANSSDNSISGKAHAKYVEVTDNLVRSFDDMTGNYASSSLGSGLIANR